MPYSHLVPSTPHSDSALQFGQPGQDGVCVGFHTAIWFLLRLILTRPCCLVNLGKMESVWGAIQPSGSFNASFCLSPAVWSTWARWSLCGVPYSHLVPSTPHSDSALQFGQPGLDGVCVGCHTAIWFLLHLILTRPCCLVNLG